jgi:hypothetical protein
MKKKIAVATVSGKAYYLIVNELKIRGVPFMSILPTDPVPVWVHVVITTKEERAGMKHKNVLEYKDEDLAKVVDEAVRLTRGREAYQRLVVGVDPGQNFGVAVLGDGAVIETRNCTNIQDTVDETNHALERNPATHKIVRIGNGASKILEELRCRLDDVLTLNVVIESVSEEGTSKPMGQTSNTRVRRDVFSAIKIGQRQGRVLPRRLKH